MVLDIDFMTSNILKLEFFFHIPWIHYKVEGIVPYICRKKSNLCILSYFKQILDNYEFNICTYTLLAPSSKICRLFLKKYCQHTLLGFVGQCVFQMFMIFLSQKSNLVYSVELLSLTLMQGNEVVYLTMLVPINNYTSQYIVFILHKIILGL